jgi:tetratricopeptide (TPR) repeat protein
LSKHVSSCQITAGFPNRWPCSRGGEGQWDQSESYFNEAERLDALNVNLLTQHAFSYSDLCRFPKALRKLDQVLDIAPDDRDTLVQKAAIARAQGVLLPCSLRCIRRPKLFFLLSWLMKPPAD